MGINEKVIGRVEFVLTQDAKKGTGKAWVKEIIVGRAGYYVPPLTVEVSENKIKARKIYMLAPGTYLVNEEGTQEKDFNYKVQIDKNLEMKRIN